MKYTDNHPSSRDFHHLHRDLRPGERPPPLPSLAQQIAACKMPVAERYLDGEHRPRIEDDEDE